MNKTQAGQVLLGSLLIGVAIATSNAFVLAAAVGSFGVNWTSEGLSGLWRGAAGPLLAPGSPLASAYERALRKAIQRLRAGYDRQYGKVGERAAFDLLSATAGSVASAQYPPDTSDLASAQSTLRQSLDDLLFGHDSRQIAWIKTHLLESSAVAFQAELETDSAAWHSFYGWLITQTASNVAALAQTLHGLPEVLRQLDTHTVVVQSVNAARDTLAAQIGALHADVRATREDVRTLNERPPAGGKSVTFNNQGMQVSGPVNQAGGDLYVESARAEGAGASASVHNTTFAPLTPPAWFMRQMQPAPAAAIRVLAVFASPADAPPLDVRREGEVLQECLRRAGQRIDWRLVTEVTVKKLSDWLFEYSPHILHFGGHGSLEGLFFAPNSQARVETRDMTLLTGGASAESEGSHLAPRAALIAELHAHTPPLRCLVLNACHTDNPKSDLQFGVPYVIAMRGSIHDAAALAFSEGFYTALAAERTIPQAYDAGCSRIRLNRLPDADVPILLDEGR